MSLLTIFMTLNLSLRRSLDLTLTIEKSIVSDSERNKDVMIQR